MRTFALLVAAASAALATAASAETVTINFDQHDPNNGYGYGPQPRGPVDEGAYRFSDSASWINMPGWGQTANSGTIALLKNYGDGQMSLARIDGGVFALDSFFLKGWAGGTVTFDVLGYLAGSQIASRSVTAGTSWNQVAPGFAGVDRVVFNMSNPFVLDDVTVSAADAGAVPEPASWALMIGGFGLVGAAMRRRRTALAFT